MSRSFAWWVVAQPTEEVGSRIDITAKNFAALAAARCTRSFCEVRARAGGPPGSAARPRSEPGPGPPRRPPSPRPAGRRGAAGRRGSRAAGGIRRAGRTRRARRPGQPGPDAVGHRDRHGPVELHHRGRREPRQLGVQGRDLQPVGARRVRRGGVAGRDRGLHLVRPGPPHGQRVVDRRHALGDQFPVPAGPVLGLQRDQHPVLGPRRAPGLVQQHQCEQPARFGLVGHQPGPGPGPAGWPRPSGPGARRVPRRSPG